MYSRKLKKKLTGTNSGSVGTSKWGPRAALEAHAQAETAAAKVYSRNPVFKNPYAQTTNSEVSMVKKPLSVIIPNQKDRRYDYTYREDRHGGPRHHSYDSLPSTDTWRSDSDPEPETDLQCRKLSQKLSLPKESETIEVRIPTCRNLKPESNDTYRLDLDSESSCYSDQTQSTEVKGQSGSFLGLQMVYVPMENETKKTGRGSTESLKPTGRSGTAPNPQPHTKDPDGDSLLESFDSVLFKPNPKRSTGSPGTSSGVGSTATPTSQNPEESIVFKSGLVSASTVEETAPKKNLRFESPNRQSFCKCTGHAFVAAAILPCGHAPVHDNYSTISSTASTPENGERKCYAENSALQQLRDLSILIGGSFHHPVPSKSPTDSATNLRKTSTTTATSADSGKGSASAPTQTSTTTPPVDEDPNSCIFRPNCKECIASTGLYRNPFEAPKLPRFSKKPKGTLKRKPKFVKKSPTKKLSPGRVIVQEIRSNVCECNCACFSENGNRRNSAVVTNHPKQHSSAPSKFVQLFPIVEEEENGENIRHIGHAHPRSWRAPDPSMGWSDLESLYSANFKSPSPVEIDGECWKCWREMSEVKRGQRNTTLDRTKRMFIWLNRRPEEFLSPWWETKKDASMKWLLSKAYVKLAPASEQLFPYRDSKNERMKLRLKEDVIRDLTNGKLYTLALYHLYNQSDKGNAHAQMKIKPGDKLSLWNIIQVLCRKGVYVAQPSDIKLTEGTLRQRRPIKIAAHMALIESMMNLYSTELVRRERMSLTLVSFGHVLGQDASTPEELIVAWINAVVTTLKTHILTSSSKTCYTSLAPYAPPSSHTLKWLQVGSMTELRDVSDGVGLCALFVLYFSKDINLHAVSIPEFGEPLNLYESTKNHALVQKCCEDFFPRKIYHLKITDFLYVHGYMKQNVLAFLVDLFMNLEVNPIVRVNRLTQGSCGNV